MKKQESFHEDSDKILLFQWLQVLHYFSRAPLPSWAPEKISNEVSPGNLISWKDSYIFKILIYQWLQVWCYFVMSTLPSGTL